MFYSVFLIIGLLHTRLVWAPTPSDTATSSNQEVAVSTAAEIVPPASNAEELATVASPQVEQLAALRKEQAQKYQADQARLREQWRIGEIPFGWQDAQGHQKTPVTGVCALPKKGQAIDPVIYPCWKSLKLKEKTRSGPAILTITEIKKTEAARADVDAAIDYVLEQVAVLKKHYEGFWLLEPGVALDKLKNEKVPYIIKKLLREYREYTQRWVDDEQKIPVFIAEEIKRGRRQFIPATYQHLLATELVGGLYQKLLEEYSTKINGIYLPRRELFKEVREESKKGFKEWLQEIARATNRVIDYQLGDINGPFIKVDISAHQEKVANWLVQRSLGENDEIKEQHEYLLEQFFTGTNEEQRCSRAKALQIKTACSKFLAEELAKPENIQTLQILGFTQEEVNNWFAEELFNSQTAYLKRMISVRKGSMETRFWDWGCADVCSHYYYSFNNWLDKKHAQEAELFAEYQAKVSRAIEELPPEQRPLQSRPSSYGATSSGVQSLLASSEPQEPVAVVNQQLHDTQQPTYSSCRDMFESRGKACIKVGAVLLAFGLMFYQLVICKAGKTCWSHFCKLFGNVEHSSETLSKTKIKQS